MNPTDCKKCYGYRFDMVTTITQCDSCRGSGREAEGILKGAICEYCYGNGTKSDTRRIICTRCAGSGTDPEYK